jgi:hypothetical protein
MESIPKIDMSDSNDTLSSDDSEYLERKSERDKNKKQQLMAQRLRGRLAKTQRLRKDSDTNYDNPIISDSHSDITEHWNQIKDKKPEEVRNFSSVLFKGKGGRTRKVRKMKKRRTRKVRCVKKTRKSKRTRK